jgi:hypothetical protein
MAITAAFVSGLSGRIRPLSPVQIEVTYTGTDGDSRACCVCGVECNACGAVLGGKVEVRLGLCGVFGEHRRDQSVVRGTTKYLESLLAQFPVRVAFRSLKRIPVSFACEQVPDAPATRHGEQSELAVASLATGAQEL